MAMRRWWVNRKRPEVEEVWPILPGSERAPVNWAGWPEGKRFAVVLTHDVEGPRGVEQVRNLMRLEMEEGFRSSFNFVPKGSYEVPADLREELVRNGFEVGVHDYHHDGSLYKSRRGFARQAMGINETLREWGAVGFRSGFMLNRLDWLHDLSIEYDASTFDTDPFEPQPEGQHTIFPFWVPSPRRNWLGGKSGDGYVELPYTLPQDSTVYLLLAEKSSEIWTRKVDWITSHGGMILVNTHPDYMDFDGEGSGKTFPARHYRSLLRHIAERYQDEYWHALPREVASYVKPRHAKAQMDRPPSAGVFARQQEKSKIWIDLDNTPHIPFFRPIIRELERRGHAVVLTARDAYQVCEMATSFNMYPLVVGKHYGRQKVRKVFGFLYRALQLMPIARAASPTLALNHGSRSQVLLSNLLGIPSVTIMDYEHSQTIPMARPDWMIVPRCYPEHVPGLSPAHLRRYSGIKEDVYVPEFAPDASICTELGLNSECVIVTIRPPASEAHYHNPEADVLFDAFMNRIIAMDGVTGVLLPRNQRQKAQIEAEHAEWLRRGTVIIPSGVVNGLNLLWHSDLVVSGGGTMNREAAAMGVPVYSLFRGKSAAVDVQLQKEGRMFLIENQRQIHDRIRFERRAKKNGSGFAPRPALSEIVNHLEQIMEEGVKTRVARASARNL